MDRTLHERKWVDDIGVQNDVSGVLPKRLSMGDNQLVFGDTATHHNSAIRNRNRGQLAGA